MWLPVFVFFLDNWVYYIIHKLIKYLHCFYIDVSLDSTHFENHICLLFCYIGTQCYIIDKNIDSGPYCPDQSSGSANYYMTWASYGTSQCVGVLIWKVGVQYYCEDEFKLMHTHTRTHTQNLKKYSAYIKFSVKVNHLIKPCFYIFQ